MNAEPATANQNWPRSTSRWFLDFFRAALPAATMLTDPAEIKRKYSRWQTRVLIFSIVGYATFYFVRKNFSIVQPFIGRDLHIDKSHLGLILTLHGQCRWRHFQIPETVFSWPISANARVFMASALLFASALLNVWFGFSSALGIFITIWMLERLLSGDGISAPCARLMA